MSLVTPEGYDPILDIRETEVAIKRIKDLFEIALAKHLNLTRVSAPLFVFPETGLNDNLNGVERPVGFDIKDVNGKTAEIVHSLAKWKRFALKRYGFKPGEGLYTDMNAIRRDEELDNIHSIYVDQWDWEVIINKSDRSPDTLKEYVDKIYKVFKTIEGDMRTHYPQIEQNLPEHLTYITTQELEDKYPNLSPKERENAICKEFGAVFLMNIGGTLKSGTKHDGRAPDYDDWNLNGDLLFWYPILEIAYEVSSMGIRVCEDTLLNQLKISGCEDRLSFDFHKSIMNKDLPYTIGGGLGQSRICMFFLKKAHIGEVQASVWSKEMIETCEKDNIKLL